MSQIESAIVEALRIISQHQRDIYKDKCKKGCGIDYLLCPVDELHALGVTPSLIRRLEVLGFIDVCGYAVEPDNPARAGESVSCVQLMPAGEVRLEDAEMAAERRPLGVWPRKLYKKLLSLEESGAMTTEEILDWLTHQGHTISQGTLTSRILPKLKPYGLFHEKRIGFCIRNP